jgi:hypothetical protein
MPPFPAGMPSRQVFFAGAVQSTEKMDRPAVWMNCRTYGGTLIFKNK